MRESDSYTPVAEPRKGARKHLTFAETRAVMQRAAATGDFERVLVRLLYEVALRAGEVGQLRLDHLKRLHLAPAQLYLPRAKGSAAGWATVSGELAQMLSVWVQTHHRIADVAVAAYGDPARFVFPGGRRNGRARGVTRQTVYNAVKDVCLAAGTDPSVAHPHALRHARAMHLFEEAERQGLDPRDALITVAKLLGHKSAKTSLENYIAETGRGREVADAAFRRATEGDYDGEL
jgi:integrase